MTEARALVIQPDGRSEVVITQTDLDSIKGLIGGGWLEAVAGVYGEWTAYGDEEGKLKGMAPNLRAMIVAEKAGVTTDVLVGTVVFFGLVMEDPEDGYRETDVPPELVALA